MACPSETLIWIEEFRSESSTKQNRVRLFGPTYGARLEIPPIHEQPNTVLFCATEGMMSDKKRIYVRVPIEVFESVPEIGPDSCVVYLALAQHVNREGLAWPSVKRIASLTGLSPRQVHYCLNSLETKRFLKRLTRHGRSTVYDLGGAFRCTTSEGSAHCADPPLHSVQTELYPVNYTPTPPDRDCDSTPPRFSPLLRIQRFN